MEENKRINDERGIKKLNGVKDQTNKQTQVSVLKALHIFHVINRPLNSLINRTQPKSDLPELLEGLFSISAAVVFSSGLPVVWDEGSSVGMGSDVIQP